MKIPFNKPFIVGNELQYIQDAISTGSIASGGKYTQKCESFLEARYNVPKVMLTTSCTDALELAALILEIQPGDKVLVPSFTYVSTANAFALRGAEIVFVDCNTDNMNLDLEDLKQKIDSSIKALVVMHYAGVGNDMDQIVTLCKAHNVFLIEDAALAIESNFKGKQLGTFGQLGTFSFHETKNVISGEGGALLINDSKLVAKAYQCRDKGTNRKQFLNGEVDKYSWTSLGSSFAPSDLIAAYLWGQLENIDQIQEKRLLLWNTYNDAFYSIQNKKFQIGKPIMGASFNGSVFYFLMKEEQQRDHFISYLGEHGVKAVFHYQALSSSPFMKSTNQQNLNAVNASKRLVRLPMYFNLNSNEQDYIIQTVQKFFSSLKLNV